MIEGVMDAESGDDDKDDVKLTHPTGCFGWSQLVFHDYFTALTHSVDSSVLLNTPNFVDCM